MSHERKPIQRNEEERNKLVEQWIYLPRFMVNRYFQNASFKHHLPFDDMLGVAYLALVEAAGLWDETREIKFNTYACRAMYNNILREACRGGVIRLPLWLTQKCHGKKPSGRLVDKANKAQMVLSTSTLKRKSRKEIDGEFQFGEDLIAPEEKSMREEEDRQEIDKIHKKMRFLSKKHRTVLIDRFLRGKTFQEIADIMGLTKEAIRKMEQKAIQKLKILMEVDT